MTQDAAPNSELVKITAERDALLKAAQPFVDFVNAVERYNVIQACDGHADWLTGWATYDHLLRISLRVTVTSEAVESTLDPTHFDAIRTAVDAAHGHDGEPG